MRERSTSADAVDFTEAATKTKSLPQNGTVRSEDQTPSVYGAGPGRSHEGNESDAAAAENARAPNNQ